MNTSRSVEGRPDRCTVTKLGLVLVVVAIACLATIGVVQFAKTGSLARGNGFAMGPYLGMPMLASLGAALLLLAAGGVVD
jgi:hypothetical protein